MQKSVKIDISGPITFAISPLCSIYSHDGIVFLTGDNNRHNSESRHPKDNRVSKYEQFDFHEVIQLFSC